MNERLKELADEAKQSALNTMIKIADKEQALKVYSETYDTKFDELIVRECAEYAEHNLDMAGYKKKFMLKHFGVE